MRTILDAVSLPALEPLIASAIRSTALIALAGLAALALRRASAAQRHLAWTLALLGCIAMPAASRIVPGWALPGLPAWRLPALQRDAHTAREGLPSVGDLARSDGSRAHGVSSLGAQASSPTDGQRSLPNPVPTPAAPAEGTSMGLQLRAADLVRLAPLVWLAGVLLLLGRHVAAWGSLSRIARQAAPVTDRRWTRALVRHSAVLGLGRVPDLRISAQATVPMVCGAARPTILLPAGALAWSSERCDAVLLHELAHVRRCDLLAAHAAQLAVMLSWFNPLIWHAARRQRAEAERACDDQVLNAGRRASSYASDLVEIASAASGRERFRTAALAMARRSELEGRLLAILDPRRPRGAAGSLAVPVAVLVAFSSVAVLAAARPAQSRTPERAALAMTAAPAAADAPVTRPSKPQTQAPATTSPSAEDAAATIPDAAPTDAAAPGDAAASPVPSAPSDPSDASASGLLAAGGTRSSWHVTDTDGKGETRSGSWVFKDSRGSFKSKGAVKFSAKLDDIASISPGGFVEIDDRRGGQRYEAKFQGRSGGMERTYRVNGVNREWDDDARAWLAKFLIDLDHGSGAFVAERFPRLMDEGGPTRVLQEISLMSSDYGRGLYFSQLLAGDLDAPTLRRAVTQAGREIDSDYELGRTLMAAAAKHALEDAATRTAYLEATNSIESDYEHARVLLVLIARRDLSTELVAATIGSASEIDSDYEQARVMIAMVEKGHVTAPRQRSFLGAVRTIESDYEKGRVLCTLIERGQLAEDNVEAMLAASATIQSSYEHANVLVDLAESMSLDEGQRAAFVNTAERIGSSYERSRALAALARPSR